MITIATMMQLAIRMTWQFGHKTHSKLENSLKILKTHSNFWCRHAAEGWDLEFDFQTPVFRSVMFVIKQNTFSYYS